MAPRSPHRRHLPHLTSQLIKPPHPHPAVLPASSSTASSESTNSKTPSSDSPHLPLSPPTVESPNNSLSLAEPTLPAPIGSIDPPITLAELKLYAESLDPSISQSNSNSNADPTPIPNPNPNPNPSSVPHPNPSQPDHSPANGSHSSHDSVLIEEEEKPADYDKGGYHPVSIGELFCNGRYLVLRKLGWGHFSTVWLARDRQLDRHVALKVVKSAHHYTETAEDEIKLLERVVSANPSHPGYTHVVALLDHFKHKGPNGTHVCMVFEVLGENLLGLIKRYEYRGLPAEIVRVIGRQVLLGLDYLHRECGIIHTDLKPENVLICIDDVETVVRAELGVLPATCRAGAPPRVPTSPGAMVTGSQPLPSPRGSSTTLDKLAFQMSAIPTESRSGSVSPVELHPAITVKIADLGNASWVSNHFTDDIQTRQYRSPEAILGAPWGPKVDIWSAGCMLFELLTGDYLFNPDAVSKRYTKDDDHIAQIIELVGRFPLEIALSGKFSHEIFNRKGELKKIHKLKPWTLESVLTDKYGLDRELGGRISWCLGEMIQVDAKRRSNANELLNEPGGWMSNYQWALYEGRD